MSATHVEFTPSTSAVLPVSQIPAAVALPPVDPANTAVVLRNLSHHMVAIKAGAAGMAHFQQPGTVTVRGKAVVLTTDASLANSDAATVMTMGGVPAALDGAAKPGLEGGTGLVFTRGSLRDVWLFAGRDTAVF